MSQHCSVPTSESTLRVVTVGHVDHGKSTLVGRILHETDSLPDGKYEDVAEYCRENHKPFEYAFLLDALEEERDQGITIDTAQVWFSTPEREFTMFDAPGHREFVKNMVCGAAHADVALMMIDAQEGVREQSRRHGFLLGFLGIAQIVVVVNKMDLVGWNYDRFAEIDAEFVEFLSEVGVKAVTFIPISAREGDNVTKKSANMSWYRGPTVLESLHEMEASKPPEDQPLRFCIQDVFKFDDRRILAGRVESGRISKGDEILFTPSNKRARVASIERWSVKDNPQTAAAGESIGFTLDEQLFLERGELVSHVENAPVVTDVFRARVFWMGTEPMVKNKTYRIKLLTQEADCEVDSFDRIIDASTLKDIAGDAEELPKNDTAEVTIRVERPIAVDAFETVRESGRFVLVDGHDVCGGGTLAPIVYPDQRTTLNPEVTSKNITWDDSLVTASDRVDRNGHAGAVIWMTGLSGAGKSTISKMLERKLYESGVQVYRLDGDNVRHGLNADLGFSPDDRAENIRRIAEVANLMADSGLVVLTSFISPYRSDRRNARECVKTGKFFEIFVDCSVEACEKRDPKGLYRKARSGEIKEFTGISAPYEKPQAADIYVNTEDADPAETVESILARLADYGVMPGAASSA